MRDRLKQALLEALWRGGWRLGKRYPVDLGAETREVAERVLPVSGWPARLFPIERLAVLSDAVRYVVDRPVPGAIVECGVYRGASMMVVALELLRLREERELWLYDTFTGMTRPGDKDVSTTGRRALTTWQKLRTGHDSSAWVAATEDSVRENMRSTGYAGPLHFVKGKVEDTIPQELSLIHI